MRPRRALLHMEAHIVAACVRVGLRVLSFSRVAALAGRLPARRAPGGGDVVACVAAARGAAARVAYPTCLFESLIALAMLRRRGHAVELHIGARRAEGFEAHAWLTVGGVAIDRAAATPFVPLWRFTNGAPS